MDFAPKGQIPFKITENDLSDFFFEGTKFYSSMFIG